MWARGTHCGRPRGRRECYHFRKGNWDLAQRGHGLRKGSRKRISIMQGFVGQIKDSSLSQELGKVIERRITRLDLHPEKVSLAIVT